MFEHNTFLQLFLFEEDDKIYLFTINMFTHINQ